MRTGCALNFLENVFRIKKLWIEFVWGHKPLQKKELRIKFTELKQVKYCEEHTHLTDNEDFGRFITRRLRFCGVNFLEKLVEHPHESVIVF